MEVSDDDSDDSYFADSESKNDGRFSDDLDDGALPGPLPLTPAREPPKPHQDSDSDLPDLNDVTDFESESDESSTSDSDTDSDSTVYRYHDLFGDDDDNDDNDEDDDDNDDDDDDVDDLPALLDPSSSDSGTVTYSDSDPESDRESSDHDVASHTHALGVDTDRPNRDLHSHGPRSCG